MEEVKVQLYLTGDNLLIKRDVSQQYYFGKVVAVADVNGEIKVGEMVFFKENSETEIKLNNEDFVIVSASAVIGGFKIPANPEK
jgi:co-chaperonin GroES (HSP10)